MGSNPAGAPIDVLLVCSSGGHALQLNLLRGAWQGYESAWVTLEAEDTRSLFATDRVIFAHGPTNRNVPNLFRNLRLAWTLMRNLKPRVMVTTGAGVAVPFAWIGRVLGTRIVYIESFTRVESPSLSCRMIAPVTDRLYAQWPELAQNLRKARYVGAVVGKF